MNPRRQAPQVVRALLERPIFSEASIEDVVRDFERFCEIDRRLARLTVKGHRENARRFISFVKKPVSCLAREDVRSYLACFRDASPYSYANQLKTLRVFCRDYLERPDLAASFKFPERPVKVKRLPTKQDLQCFYQALPNLKERALFLLYASTGLRRGEVLGLRLEDIDWATRMVIPNHSGRTKKSYITFFNEESEQVLKEYLESRRDVNPKLFPMWSRKVAYPFREAREVTGLRITPRVLRDWFCQTMGELGVSDRFIDAFCGRVPKSVLARHYSDYSPERLKRIYDAACLRVLA